VPLRNHVGIGETISDCRGAGEKVFIESIEEGGAGTAAAIALHYAISSVHYIPLSKNHYPAGYCLLSQTGNHNYFVVIMSFHVNFNLYVPLFNSGTPWQESKMRISLQEENYSIVFS
jgi:hypothetical protein